MCHSLVPSFKSCWLQCRASARLLVYSGDTGDCPEAQKLAENADVLIIEAALPPGTVGVTTHLTPENAAKIAARAGAKRHSRQATRL